jgi:hypothetical protein
MGIQKAGHWQQLCMSLNVRIPIGRLQSAGLCGDNSTIYFEKNKDNIKHVEK